MKKTTGALLVFASVLLLFVNGCGSQTQPTDTTPTADNPTVQPPANTQIANPASTNCTAKGGKLEIVDKVIDGKDRGQYGICYFEDNRQCEEWALMRGECPVGGVKVTGYITEAATYCAITGGEYAVTKQSPDTKPENEQGTCTLKSGKVCDAQDYYKGACPVME